MRRVTATGIVVVLLMPVFVVGICAGFILGLEAAKQLLSEWQTLIAGVLAVAAALGTIIAMNKQTNAAQAGVQRQLDANRERRADDTRRKRMAASAVLPADLAALCEYCRYSANVIVFGFDKLAGTSALQGQMASTPMLPDRVLSNLQNLIQHLDIDEAVVIHSLLACLQVQNSRLDGLVISLNGTSSSQFHMLNPGLVNLAADKTLELQYRASELFPYSRMEARRIVPPNFDLTAVSNAALNLELFNHLGNDYLVKFVAVMTKAAA